MGFLEPTRDPILLSRGIPTRATISTVILRMILPLVLKYLGLSNYGDRRCWQLAGALVETEI